MTRTFHSNSQDTHHPAVIPVNHALTWNHHAPTQSPEEKAKLGDNIMRSPLDAKKRIDRVDTTNAKHASDSEDTETRTNQRKLREGKVAGIPNGQGPVKSNEANQPPE